MSLADVKIALVELPSTLAAALASYLGDAAKGVVTIFDHLDDVADAADIIVTDPVRLLSHLDFYLPRKGKVAVVCLSRQSGDVSLPVTTLYLSDSPEETLRRLSAMVTTEEDTLGQNSHVLTVREIEVLKGVASGRTNKEIADMLCISVNTVITHRKNVTNKLGIRSASGLSLYAMMNGII